LNESEADYLKKLAGKSGLSCGVYMRSLIKGLVPADRPPPDNHKIMNELRAIGNNMNQVAQKAHILNVIDSKRYDEGYSMLKEAIVTIVNAVSRPCKVERKLE